MTDVTIRNPIIRGFNPDPSIVRVDDDYYIATSTFEWFPAVRLHHSRDLVNWRTIGHALTDADQLDLRGIPDSGGVWAPSLTFTGGEFWLAYSVIRTMNGDNKDLDNYLVTAPGIDGPWSEPVRLGSRGFDASFFHDSDFHDTDGRHWIVGVQWDARPGFASFAGIVLQEYDHSARRVVGDPAIIARDEGLIEGPNLYHLDGWYYLTLAQGGTGWNHGISVRRSRDLLGPYEVDPQRSVITSRDNPEFALQKAGHGELVQTQSGEWVIVHLASRPVAVDGERYCITGRETCLQRVVWDDDGWLRLADGGIEADTSVAAGGLGALSVSAPGRAPARDDFDDTVLDTRRFSTLRAPLAAASASLTARPGWLRLAGGQSPASVFDQSLLGQRIEENTVRAETVVDARPTTPAQAAGLVAWYDTSTWVWAQVTWDEAVGRHVRLVWSDLGTVTRSESSAALTEEQTGLRFALADAELSFDYRDGAGDWRSLGEPWPAWKLSDDYGGGLRFTGAFAAIRADDLDGIGWSADFDYLELSSPID